MNTGLQKMAKLRNAMEIVKSLRLYDLMIEMFLKFITAQTNNLRRILRCC